MKTLKDIFGGIEGRDWVYHNFPVKKIYRTKGEISRWTFDCGNALFTHISLPDLLANKSWTDALGLSRRQTSIAFDKLWGEGQQQALDYITETMI